MYIQSHALASDVQQMHKGYPLAFALSPKEKTLGVDEGVDCCSQYKLHSLFLSFTIWSGSKNAIEHATSSPDDKSWNKRSSMCILG